MRRLSASQLIILARELLGELPTPAEGYAGEHPVRVMVSRASATMLHLHSPDYPLSPGTILTLSPTGHGADVEIRVQVVFARDTGEVAVATVIGCERLANPTSPHTRVAAHLTRVG